jgi:hypothetical protein
MEKISKKISQSEEIRCINFNQDSSCFCIGTEKGYYIYNSVPCKLLFSRSKKKEINNL